MAQTTEYIYRLKGGEQIAVEYQDPILDRREPVVIYCEDGSTKMKIGDGIHKYSELPYLRCDIKEGDAGATFTPSVSDEGIISWTNDKNLPNPSSVDIKGPKGDRGDKGDSVEIVDNLTTRDPNKALSAKQGLELSDMIVAHRNEMVPEITNFTNSNVFYPTVKAMTDYVKANVTKVDEHYDSTSTNAQSGIAVAEAISASADNGFFEITTDGIVSLKPKYRGAVNFDKYKTLSLDFSGDYTFAISDNGKNFVGSKNHLLPHNLIVPPVINDIEVKSFQIGTFAFNDRIQTLTIPDTVTVIPDLFADMAVNLNTVQGLENIKTIGKNAFRVTATEVFNVPSIIQGGLGNAIFVYCSRLKFVNLGENISFIPEETFYGCYKLINVRCKNVVEVGTRAFARTFSLYQCDFLKNGKVNSIGDYAFMSSAIPFDFTSLNATFGDNAIWSKTTNPNIDWKSIDFVECINNLPTNMSQKDSRWANEHLFALGGKEYYYGDGACTFLQ